MSVLGRVTRPVRALQKEERALVFVLDRKKKPLMPCSEKQARKLLEEGKAVVHRLVPFVIRLKDRELRESLCQKLRLKIDPGYEVTGISVVRVAENKEVVVLLIEVHHRMDVSDALKERSTHRRSRRSRKTRYREPRFDNRRRVEGWLPPSVDARIRETLSVVEKLCRWLPVAEVVVESAKFDTQKMQDPEISGVEYQRGTLFGYELREYLLEKFGRRCAYCGKEGIPLEVEHVVPRSRGGSNRASNLALACRECNEAKGNKLPDEWLDELKKSKRSADKKRAENLERVLNQIKEPLKGAAYMNATRYALAEKLKALGVPVFQNTAAQTKYNRARFNLPKTHYYDACCVGEASGDLEIAVKYVLIFRAIGRGTRKMVNLDGNGFPRGHRARRKLYYGFMTGDLVVAEAPRGRYAGRHVGHIAVRASGCFDLKDISGHRICQGVSWRHFKLLQRFDGWRYEKFKTAALSSPYLKAGASSAA